MNETLTPLYLDKCFRPPSPSDTSRTRVDFRCSHVNQMPGSQVDLGHLFLLARTNPLGFIVCCLSTCVRVQDLSTVPFVKILRSFFPHSGEFLTILRSCSLSQSQSLAELSSFSTPRQKRTFPGQIPLYLVHAEYVNASHRHGCVENMRSVYQR